jgi:NDP-sugar pyrophosphorylase family protein
VALDSEGWVTRFVEKPAPDVDIGNLANSGVNLVQPEVVNWIPAGSPFDFGHDLFPRLLESRVPLLGYGPGDYVLDIGSPERYAQAQADLESGRFRSCLYASRVG